MTGTTHLGNGYRAYNPVLMCFHSPDSMSPFGAGGINSYAYCVGDPVNQSDPSGHAGINSVGGIGLRVLGLFSMILSDGESLAVSSAKNATLKAPLIEAGSGATLRSKKRHNKVKGRRAVISQGTYGIFPTEGLDLSMPAVQTCIGVYAEDRKSRKLMAAHFDSKIGLDDNLSKIMNLMKEAEMDPKSTKVRIFGGDGWSSLLRGGAFNRNRGRNSFLIYKGWIRQFIYGILLRI